MLSVGVSSIQLYNAKILGRARALFYTFAFCYYVAVPKGIGEWAALPPVFWQPVGVFHFFPVLSTKVGGILETIWLGTLVFAALGLFSRIATACAFFLGFYVLGLINNFGKVGHDATVFVLILGIMAISRAGDAFSLDAFFRSRGLRRGQGVRSDIDYAWPFELVACLILLTYGIAGLQKLRLGGLDFFLTDAIARDFTFSGRPLGKIFAAWPHICRVFAFSALLAELLAWPALFFRAIRGPLFAYFFVFHLFSALVLPVNFIPLLICYVFLLPWPLAPHPTWRTAPGFVRALGLGLFVLHANAAIRLEEHWPIGAYRMYAYAKRETRQFRVYQVLDGKELPGEINLPRPLNPNRLLAALKRFYKSGDYEALDLALVAVASFRNGATGARYYLETWPEVGPIDPSRPETRTLLREIRVQAVVREGK